MCTCVSSTRYQQSWVSLTTWLTECRTHWQEGQVLGCEPSCCQVHLQIQRNALILWVQVQFCLRNEKVSLIPAEDPCCQGWGGVGAAWLSAEFPLWKWTLKCCWHGLPDTVGWHSKKVCLTIQEAFSSPKYPCKYAEIFFYKVLNNYFACGFLGTSCNL